MGARMSTKNGLPYYKRYPRDFIEGTIGMPFELKAAYSVVLDLIYMQGGELPDDPRYISGLLGLSVRKWNSIRKDLIAVGKIQVNGEFLTNYRAVIELESLGKLQDKQRENRSRPNKNKDLQTPRSDHTEPEPDTESNTAAATLRDSGREAAAGSCGMSENPADFGDAPAASPSPPKPSGEMSDDRLYDEVLAAAGLKGGRLPAHWLPPGATRHIGRWRRELELTPDQIIETVRSSRKNHDSAPSRPSAYDRAMSDFAGEIKASPLKPTAPRPSFSKQSAAPQPVYRQVAAKLKTGNQA